MEKETPKKPMGCGTILMIVCGVLLLILMLSAFSEPETNNNPPVSTTTDIQPEINTPQIPKTAETKIENVVFNKIKIKDLVDIVSKEENYKHPFVEYQGTVFKKEMYHYKNRLGETLSWDVVIVKDGGDYSFIGIDPDEKDGSELLKYYYKINSGDKIIVRGLPVNLGDCNKTTDEEDLDKIINNMCVEFNFTTVLPDTILFLPNPSLGNNKKPIEIISSSANQTAVSETPNTTISPVNIDYSSYPRIQIDQYKKNPPAYLGIGFEAIGGIVSDFLASGDRGGSTNYIEIENSMDASLDKMEIEVTSDSDYQKIVSQINKGDFINVFGLGVKSQGFTNSMGGTILIPTIKAQKIEKCQPSDRQEASTTVIFSK